MADTQYGPLQPKQQSASDIRKVIANATKTTGKGYTIANNDELKEQKDKKEQNQVKVPTPSGTATRNNTNVETPKVQTSTVKEVPQGPTPFPVIDKSQLTGDIFKNPQLQGIKNIPTFQEDNQAEHNVASRNNNDESFMNTFGRATELKKPVDVDNALMDLFVDVRGKVKSGTLAQSDVVKMKELYPEFANMGDDVILSMIGDMASIANKNMPFNNENMAKFKSLYPELTAASWGFDKGSSENMYQAGGMREQMAQSSKTDLNRFGTAGALAEGVINPLGEVTTLADMGAQMIPQVDGSGNENRLKKALSKLTDEDINKYYEQYQNYVKNHGTLSNLYTLQLEGDTVVEQLWNWATGKGKKDVDAGFRDWLIDRVNNEVNGWAGEVTGAANDLKGVGGPNIAKMYANMPASTVKTITAITRAITNPVDTAAGLYHLFGTEEGRQALIARYGSWDGFAKALEQDPVGVASDGLAVVEGGAGLTKMAAGGLSKASLLAGLSTEALGAARTTENLLKLATRLENMAIKAGKVEKTAGLASNLGADLPINKVINGLKTWGESGESLIQKASKYTANNATTGVGTIAGKVVDTGKDIIKKGPINSLADLLMGSATDSDKLFKAASPNINRLSNNVDYKNKRAKMDLAEQAIVDAGYLPKSISEWAKAHTETLNKKWNEFKQMVADKGDVMVDVRDILKEVKDYIKSEKDGATELQKQDLRKLEVEVAALERMGKVDMNFIEKRKEHYNSSWRDSDKLKVGDVYLKGIKMIGNAMRKQQDNILGKGPESTKKLRKEIAALMDTKNDVIKADVKNQKKKSDISGGGLVESYGRLSGLGDVIGGVVGGVLGKGGEGFAQAGKGLGKMVLGKAMGRAKDVDYLTKKGFEGLSKKKKAQNSAGLQSKFKDSKELGNLYVERDNLRKELKKDNISDSRKEAINKRLDDIEYAIAQKKARAGLGDKERVLSEENKKKVIDMVSKRAKDVGFTTEVLDGMEKDTQGYTDLRKKLIALEKNPGDTTAQHELFHAFFSVVDNKTKTYILDEAKKILKESGMKDVNAEEWLAESFGIYAKRKQIKLGLIDAPKGFVAKVRNFFQKVYEFMQRFNGDRATINKVFDEVLGDRQMKNGIIDLSDLLGDKEVKVRELGDNGLRNKAVYHGSPADFDKFDSSHMGEGEGNQAHGWGHYVAVDKKTAEKYANLNTNQKLHTELTYKGKLNSLNPDNYAIKQLDNEYWLNYYDDVKGFKEDFPEIKESILKDSKRRLNMLLEDFTAEKSKKDIDNSRLEHIKDNIKKLDSGIKELENMKAEDFGGKEVGGRQLYNLDIPDPVKADTPTGSNYLEEDGKITYQQVEKLADFLEKYDERGNWGKNRFLEGIVRDLENLSGGWDDKLDKYVTKGDITGRKLYEHLVDYFGGRERGEKAASKFLESLGYDGIHYFGGSDGEAYVIFNDDALKIKDHIRYKKKIGDKDVEITPKVKSPDELIEKNADGLSVMKSFISEKQAEKALNVSKDILDENGNAYLWTHTNKYNDKMFANFESTRDSKYATYSNADVAWFTNSLEMSKTYSANDSKLAPTKKFTNIDDFNKYAEKNKIDEGWKWDRYGDIKEINKTTIAENNGQYIPYTTKTFEYKFNNLFDAYETFNDKGLMEGRGVDRLIGEMPKTEEEAYSKFEKYIKGFENGKVTNKGNKLKDLEASLDVDNIIGYFDNKDAALAEAYAKSTPSDDYHYQGVAQNLKKPYVVDYSSNKKPQMWNKLGTLKDFAKKEGGRELSKIFETMDKYQNEKWDILDFIDEGKKALLDKDNHYIDGNMIEDKDYFLGNIQQALRDGTVKLILDSPSWEGEEFAKIKNDIVANGKTFGDLHDMLKKMSGTDDVFYSDFKAMGDLPTVLKDFGVPEATRTLIMQKLVDREFYKSAGISYADRIRIHGLADLEKKLNGIDLETNDYVRYALNDGNYDGVIFKNIIDYGGTPKEGWDSAKGGDVLTTFKSNQFKSWDNSTPTDSKYISYKKKVSLDKNPEGLSKKDSNGLIAKGRERTLGNDGMRYKKDLSIKEKDAEYEKAVKEGDTEKALGMLRKAAADKGYMAPEDYKGKGAWVAPSSSVDRKDFTNLEELRKRAEDGDDINLYGIAQGVSSQPDDYFGPMGARYYSYNDKTGMQSYYPIKKAMDSIKAQMENYGMVKRMPEIEVYRAVPDYKKKIAELQKDLDAFTFDKDGNPKVSDVNLLTKDGQESYAHYKDQQARGIIDDADKLLYDATKGAQEISDKWTVKEGMLQSGGEWVTPSIDYAKEHGNNRFDGNYKIIKELVPADELWWDGNDIREWGFDDGKEYVTKGVKNSRKNIEITYDRKITMPKYENGIKVKDLEVGEEKLIPLSKRFNEKKSDLRYKKKSEVPEDKKLVGLHNLGIDKLRKTIDLGGMPMPSIAVTKKGVPHESYGDITFIMKESAINPGLNPKNKIYQFDAYTPMVPNAEPILKNDAWTKQQIEMISKATGASKYEIKEWAQDEYKGRGLVDDYPKLKDFEYLLPEITEKKMFAGWNSRGGKKYKDYTMNNIIKRMKEQGNQSFFSQFNKMVAQEGGSMQSLDGLRDRKFGPKDQELWDKKRNEYTNAIQEIFEKYKGKIRGENGNIDGFKWDELNRFQELLEDSYSKSDEKWLDEVAHKGWAHSIPEMKIEDIQRIRKILKDMSDVQRPYSEAKPERAIRFDEVGAVVAPEGKLKEVKDILKDTGLKVYGYKEGERMSVVDKVADDNGLRFKKKVDQTQTPEFKKWFEGSKVVNEDGEPLAVYHGTKWGGFTEFDKKNEGIWFSRDRDVADTYTSNIDGWERTPIIKGDEYVKGDERPEGDAVYKVYLDIKKPLVLDYEGYGATNHPKLEAPSYYFERLGDKYDGIIAKNIRDEGGFNGGLNDPEERYAENTVYGVKNPNQIKSATDNIGTFDKNNPDIRYKKDSEGKDLSEGQIKHFADSKARNDKGELLVVYRGTKNIEGDRFLYSKDHQTGEDFGKAYYFTTNKDQARGYSFDDTKTQAYKDWWKKRHEYHDKYLETKDEKYRKLRDEWSDKNRLHLRDVNEMDKHPEGFGETRAYYLNIKNPLEYDAKGGFYDYEKLFKEVKEDRKWRGAEYGYDGIIVRNVKDNSVKRNGEFEDMDVFITFNQNQAKYTDNLNPTNKLSKRLKKKVGLEKKENGLYMKSNASILAKGRDRK